MKVEPLNYTRPYRTNNLHTQNNKNNNAKPSFGNLFVSYSNMLENGGFIAEFLSVDTLGMMGPRTGQGFFADFMVAGTMLAERIKGGTLILGGEENGDGMARVLDGNGNIIIQLDNSGFKCNGTGVYSDRYIRVIDGMIGFGSDKEENQYLLWAYPSVGFCLYKAKKDGTILDSIMRIDDESIYFDVDKIGPKGVPGATGRAEFSNGTYLEFKNGFLVGGNTIEGAF